MKKKNATVKINLEKFLSVCKNLTRNELDILLYSLKDGSHLAHDYKYIMNTLILKSYLKESLGIADSSIDNCISSLARKGILIREFKGVYRVNPEYLSVVYS